MLALEGSTRLNPKYGICGGAPEGKSGADLSIYANNSSIDPIILVCKDSVILLSVGSHQT